jgi:hypothetical protein
MKLAHCARRVLARLILCLPFMFVAPMGASDPGATCSALGVSFRSPLALAGPASAGLDAVVFAHPPDAPPAASVCEVFLVRLPVDLVQAMGGDDQQLREYSKTTFLGAAGPAQSRKERVILGAKVSGEILETRIPKPARVEAHLVPLAKGARLFLAVRAHEKMPAPEAEALIAAIAASLAETGAPGN